MPGVADLPGVDQVGQRGKGLIDVGRRVRPVNLVKVDVVGTEPAQAVLALPDQPAARVATLVDVLAHGAVRLGGEHDAGPAAAGQGLPDDLLRLASRVHVGGVDEVDAGVQRPVDDPDRLLMVGIAPGAEHHRAQAERADLDAGGAEYAHVS